jgi:peptide/nickel transport system permease protein
MTEQLTWFGTAGGWMAVWFATAALAVVLGLLAQAVLAFLPGPAPATVPAIPGPPRDRSAWAQSLTRWALVALVAGVVLLLVIGMVLPGTPAKGIIGAAALQFLPVWIALALTFAVSIAFKRRLGLYGKLFDSPVGMVGFGIVMFWVFTALLADMIVTFDPYSQFSGMRNVPMGTPLAGAEAGDYSHFLFGGDSLARDVFSRMVMGARSVLAIAPAATAFAFMVGITLGLPAGYFGGRLDTGLSFLANLVLAFPVILLFYLLVTPEIVAHKILFFGAFLAPETALACNGDAPPAGLACLGMSIPTMMAAILFIFPIIFLSVLLNARFFTSPMKRNLYVGLVLVLGLWAYSGLAFNADPSGEIGTWFVQTFPVLAYRLGIEEPVSDIWSMEPNLLNVFVSVVFVNAPTVFRIVRGIVMDLKSRDYVAAGQTRGEGSWYIMLWEILPNARGPLIVDFCLRIGYTTILLGTLGFFGLGVAPDSPDWGSTIDEGRKTLTQFPHAAVIPALALMSLVLGLNLLADGLREESLRD